MATPMLRQFLRGKINRSNARRMLAIEQCEARWVMDHALASAAFGMSGGSAFFEGSTVTIQNGNDIFVVDINQGSPVVRSTTSLRSTPAAVVLEEKELTLVISSQVGLSEILVYDLSDPTQPFAKQTQSVDGIVTQAWIADEKIVLQTIDPSEIPEVIPVVMLDDPSAVVSVRNESTNVEVLSDDNQSPAAAIWDLGELESGIAKPTWILPDPTLQVYDRDQLNLGAIVQTDLCGMFDDIVILPDGIVTISTARVPEIDAPIEKILDDGNSEVESMKWFTSTTLSRWSFNEFGSSLELAGSYVIEDAYAWSDVKTAVQDGVTSLFLVSARDAEDRDVRLHRFRLGTEKPFEHSDLRLSEHMDQNWIIDFAVNEKIGILATGTKLISIDLMADLSPTVMASRTFTGTSSTWKQLESELWLRISNPYDTEGNLDGTLVSLEMFEITSDAIESVGSETKIEGEDLFWSCLGPDSFTYLEESGIVVTSMQRFQKMEALIDDQESFLAVDDETTVEENKYDLLPAVIDFPQHWFYELQLFSVDRVEGIFELGNVQIDSMVIDIGESDGQVTVITDRELNVLDLQGGEISQNTLALVPTFCPVDVLGIDPGQFVEMLRRMGLGFMESMMDEQGNFIDLGLEKIVSEDIDDVIAITVGNERWQVRMGEGDVPELVTSQSRGNEIVSYNPDVNGDAEVDSIDAKILMERLNQRGFYPAPTINIGDEQQMAMDINGDGWLSALDPLIVINRINGFHEKTVEVSSEEALPTAQWLAPVLQSLRIEDVREEETTEPENISRDLRLYSDKRIDPVAIDYLLGDNSDCNMDRIDAPMEEIGKAADDAMALLGSYVELEDFESLLNRSFS
jgi:hypothetical protein